MPSGDTGLSRATELFQRKNLLSQEVIRWWLGGSPGNGSSVSHHAMEK